jgi:hypothetical protein
MTLALWPTRLSPFMSSGKAHHRRRRTSEPMIKIDRSLLEAYSRAEISRREISDRLDAEVGFGDLLAALHAEGLPLPPTRTRRE